MAQVQEILGPEQQSGFTDRELKDALWDAYFDVEQAVGALMEEKNKREAREKKKAGECFACRRAHGWGRGQGKEEGQLKLGKGERIGMEALLFPCEM